MKCSVCVSPDAGEDAPLPDCAFRRCHAASLMNPGFEPWLILFRLMKSDILSKNGLNARTLEENDWDDIPSQLLFAQMDVAWHEAWNAKRENEQAAEQLKGQVHSRGRRR